MDQRPSKQSVRKLHLVSFKLVEGILAGNYRSVFRGPGIEFDEVREYVDGDDARLIDWNVSSRFGQAFTKVFREERELTLFVIVDLSASVLAYPGRESRREIATVVLYLLALAALRNNDKVGALFFTDKVEHWVPPTRGRTHALRLVKDLLEFQPTGRGTDLAGAIRASLEVLKRRGIVFVISDFKTEGYGVELSLLAKKHDVIAVRVHDPLDDAFPVGGLVQVQDPETSEIVPVGRFPRFLESYEEDARRRRREWLGECNRRRVSTLEIATTEDPGTRLVEFFARRKSR